MKNKRSTIIAVLLAAVVVIGLPVGVYAAGNFAVVKQGQYYIVDTVKNEATTDGVLIQTIERRYIPEGRYNPNNPRVPYSSGTGYWDNDGNYINNGQWNNPNWNSQNRATQLKNFGYSSATGIMNYGAARGWTYNYRENYSTDSEYSIYIYFRYNNARNYDYVDIAFTAKTVFDNAGNPYTRYYKDGAGTAYTESDIKSMFDRTY
ncbi:MAG: hypothetical protein Q4E70_02055 [Candidatus Saccharibacteria bacterium]|nr:hypothetical protein [Candidatus Saccharibacteria bacterium]